MKRIFTNPISPESKGIFFRRRQTIRQLSRRQKGTIMVLMAVTIFGIIGLLGLAIDLGFLFSARTQLQNGVDAAALAAGSGLRVTIEDATAAEQQNVVKALGSSYAGENTVFSFPSADPGPDDKATSNSVVVAPEDVIVDTLSPTGLPQVRLRSFARTPLLFAGAFGFNSMKIGASAKASLLPVDGGTGAISSGVRGAGCWRPLFLPDTFSNVTNSMPKFVSDGVDGSAPVVPKDGDYYRSRFAAGGRNIFPFIDAVNALGGEVTGLRDTSLSSEIGVKTLMGQTVVFSPKYYKIPDFAKLTPDGSPVVSLQDFASFGYCGKIRVGDDIQAYTSGDLAAYEQVRLGLTGFLQNTVGGDPVDTVDESLFHYVKSFGYPDPNTYPAIIPVLFYNPIFWKDGTAASLTNLKVTNIGLFCLKRVSPNGDLEGYFVREIISGGTPVDPINMVADSASIKRAWLPMAVQLLR